ncbi:MAG TPA: hypothetical protein VGL68_07665 [Solirubrobacteraceae bacterium]|jgi:hypothetical protein
MSVSSEVQRTLVKSPPELWAELSDPTALARHLGELGEVRITRVEPEKTVEWEAPAATGAVQLKPSGWGTKVTLTVTREVPEPEPVAVPEPIATPEIPGPEQIAAPEPIAATEPEPEAEPAIEPGPRRGFFARLFGRRHKAERAPEPAAETDPEHEAIVEPAPEAQDTSEAHRETQPGLAAELAALEESLAAETQAVLTTVLDRLGAAHHRPFSRS